MTITIPPRVQLPTGSIVVGVNPCFPNSAVLTWALNAAGSYGSRITVVSVRSRRGAPRPRHWAERAQQMALAHALAEFRGHKPGVVGTVVDGEPAAALIEASAGALLLVLGTHPTPTVPSAPLGRLTDVCLRYADCPVVLVPAGPDFPIQQ